MLIFQSSVRLLEGKSIIFFPNASIEFTNFPKHVVYFKGQTVESKILQEDAQGLEWTSQGCTRWYLIDVGKIHATSACQ